MKRITLLFAASVLCFSQAAKAEDSGAYVAGGINVDGQLTACTNTTATCNSYSTYSSGARPTVIVGYDFNKFVGIEAAWARFGSFNVANSVGTYVGKVESSGLSLGVKGGYKFRFGLSVFGKLGLGQVWNQYTPGTGWTLTMNNSQTSTGLLFGLGVQYDFNETVGVRLTREAITFSNPGYDGAVGGSNLLAVIKF